VQWIHLPLATRFNLEDGFRNVSFQPQDYMAQKPRKSRLRDLFFPPYLSKTSPTLDEAEVEPKVQEIITLNIDIMDIYYFYVYFNP
jgi:hypothetical protein